MCTRSTVRAKRGGWWQLCTDILQATGTGVCGTCTHSRAMCHGIKNKESREKRKTKDCFFQFLSPCHLCNVPGIGTPSCTTHT